MLYNGILLILGGHYRFQDELVEDTMSNDSCWKLFPILLRLYLYMPKEIYMFGVPLRTLVT